MLQRLGETSRRRHALSRKVRALVITATRELATEIGDSFARFGRYTDLHCMTLVDRVHANSLVSPLRSVDILITTPDRLVELHQQGGVDLRAVEILVLDETDRLLDMSSLPDVQRIISQLPLDRQTLLFTATLPLSINSLADTILRHPARIRIPPTQKAAAIVQQSVQFVGRPQKTSALVAWLGEQTPQRVIVFTRTRQGADRVVRQLLSCGMRAEAIHGEKTLAARQQTLARFRSAQPPVLVATDLAARGVDVDGITHIVNYDLPLEPETYVHRISRIARAGTKGVAVTFCDENERQLLKGIERLLRREISGESHPANDSSSAPAVVEAEPVSEPAPLRRRRPVAEVVSREVPTSSAATPRNRSTATARPAAKTSSTPTARTAKSDARARSSAAAEKSAAGKVRAADSRKLDSRGVTKKPATPKPAAKRSAAVVSDTRKVSRKATEETGADKRTGKTRLTAVTATSRTSASKTAAKARPKTTAAQRSSKTTGKTAAKSKAAAGKPSPVSHRR